jgi:uncharacterized protein YdiU (UPF0061 family)
MITLLGEPKKYDKNAFWDAPYNKRQGKTMTPTRTTLESLTFDNKFTRKLPCDPETGNTRHQVNRACYSRVSPTPVKAPKLVAFSREAARLLDLDEKICQSDQFTRILTGNALLDGMDPFAMCYGGHQFGNWAGQLGDGRAINLGEILNQRDERWMLQLKGAGPTPYARTADGLAVLRSSVREFLCSEAMFHLGVPTTRALSLTLTGEKVERDMFYDGHPRLEPGAVVCRIAPSFTRFGNFQILAARQENDLLKLLMDTTIETDFPQGPLPSYATWFKDICERTMTMIIHWMRVGFVHGVMNTDNMSILGLTIDYGPYGWLEDYSPGWTPNTTDAAGRRYAFKNQPQIALWNLGQLANAILPVVGHPEPLQEALDHAITFFHKGQDTMMAQKLGFNRFEPGTDRALITELLGILESVETDYTLFFRGLSHLEISKIPLEKQLPTFLEKAFYDPHQITQAYLNRLNTWIKAYGKRLAKDKISHTKKKEQMDRVNPKYVLRNYLAQTAIEKAEKNDFSGVWELLDVMRTPYDEQPDRELFAEKRPEWARHKPGCSMLSCSS